jgi:hypothetical protein
MSIKPAKLTLFLAGADNISWGGAMLVLQCPVTTHSPLNLENPVPPMPPGTSGKGTMMRIKTRSALAVPKEGYRLLGLQFSQPLLDPLANLLGKASS